MLTRIRAQLPSWRRALRRRRRLLVLSNVNWRARLLARFFPRLFERVLLPRLSGLKPGSTAR